MCGSIPAPLAAQPSMPSTTAGGGTSATLPEKTEGSGPLSKVEAASGGGAPSKLPTTGGGAADGAANLQLQQTLTSLVQALSALTELVRGMQASKVDAANGGGPVQAPVQVPVQAAPGKEAPGKPTKGGGPDGCETGVPKPLTCGGSTTSTDSMAGMKM